jgi:hypothetical protein
MKRKKKKKKRERAALSRYPVIPLSIKIHIAEMMVFGTPLLQLTAFWKERSSGVVQFSDLYKEAFFGITG